MLWRTSRETNRSCRKHISKRPSLWFDTRYAGMPLLALAWAGWSSVQVDHFPDLFVLLPVVAFWLGWTLWQIRSEKAEHARAARFLREGRGPRERGDHSELVRILDRRLARSEAEEEL